MKTFIFMLMLSIAGTIYPQDLKAYALFMGVVVLWLNAMFFYDLYQIMNSESQS